MKKFIAIVLAALMALSMTACGGAPSEEKIKAALEDGTITVEDAKAKGWIDDAWIEANFEQLDAKSKIYLLDPFETTYLDGTAASSELIEGKMCLVFINDLSEETLKKLDAFVLANEEMQALGVPVLGIVSGELDPIQAQKELEAIPFPLIIRNEDMQRSMALWGFEDMMGEPVVSVFTKEGGIYTAWNKSATTEDLTKFAKALADEE